MTPTGALLLAVGLLAYGYGVRFSAGRRPAGRNDGWNVPTVGRMYGKRPRGVRPRG